MLFIPVMTIFISHFSSLQYQKIFLLQLKITFLFDISMKTDTFFEEYVLQFKNSINLKYKSYIFWNIFNIFCHFWSN